MNERTGKKGKIQEKEKYKKNKKEVKRGIKGMKRKSEGKIDD